MTSYMLVPEWFDVSVMVSDLISVATPIAGLLVLVAGGYLIMSAVRKGTG